MQIRVGYEFVYQCPQPTPMILALNIHYSRASDLLRPDYLVARPAVPVTAYRDLFGNWCSRTTASINTHIRKPEPHRTERGTWLWPQASKVMCSGTRPANRSSISAQLAKRADSSTGVSSKYSTSLRGLPWHSAMSSPKCWGHICA